MQRKERVMLLPAAPPHWDPPSHSCLHQAGSEGQVRVDCRLLGAMASLLAGAPSSLL